VEVIDIDREQVSKTLGYNSTLIWLSLKEMISYVFATIASNLISIVAYFLYTVN
jgi:hypothetical protein